MILQHRSSTTHRRSAFTLLEILVVVAIILILASVATVATMSYLEDARINATKATLKTVETAANAVMLNHGGNMPDDFETEISKKIQGGLNGMRDGWGGQLTITVETDPNNGQPRPLVVAVGPDGTRYSSWDR